MISVSHFSRRLEITFNLVGHLRAAQDGNERSHRVLHGVAEEVDLLLHQVADCIGAALCGDKFRHALNGCVGPVGGTEGVAHIVVCQVCQLFAELLAVLGLLTAAEAGVL